MAVTFVHIPRTGGLALTEALRGSGVITRGHQPRLSGCDEAITILRDPVERFVSCWDHWNPSGLDIETLARDPERGGWWFAPASAWLDCDRPLLWVGRTETLAEDYERLRDLLGLKRDLPVINVHRHRSTLSPEGAGSVRRLERLPASASR